MRRVYILLIILMLVHPAFSFLCQEPRTPSEWYKIHHGQPTFVGVVISAENQPDVVRQGGGRPLTDDSSRTIPTSVQKATFQIEERFEGVKTKTIEIYGSGTTNDYQFKTGTRYLVYGWLGVDGRVRTGKCTRTAPLAEAAEDLRFLRGLKHQHSIP